MAALTISLTATAHAATTRASWPAPPTNHAACQARLAPALCHVHWWVRAAWHAQDRRGIPRRVYGYAAERTKSTAYRLWIWHSWKRRARHVEAMPVLVIPAGIRAGLMCIHPLESVDWHLNGGLGPEVSGGLQIALSTWIANGGSRYAPAAYLATPDQQLAVGAHIVETSGWGPWPNTARACGLL